MKERQQRMPDEKYDVCKNCGEWRCKHWNHEGECLETGCERFVADDSIPREAVELLAQCVQHNVDSAYWISQQIGESQERNLRQMCEAFAELYDALDEIPDMVRSVYVERLLTRFGSWRSTADTWGKPLLTDPDVPVDGPTKLSVAEVSDRQ